MSGIKTIPPKQKYLTLSEIYKTYGTRGVVAFSCTILDSVPQGGYVIAVQDGSDKDYSMLKEYRRQLQAKYPNKKSVCFLRLEPGTNGAPLLLTYDSGNGDVKTIPKIKKDVQESVESIPDETLALALSTALKMDQEQEQD